MWTLLLACLTPPELVEIPVQLTPSAGAFQSGEVQVEVLQASWALSSLRLEAEAHAQAPAPLWVGVAQAHPGHDTGGLVWGELLGPWALEPLGPAAELGTLACYEGELATATLEAQGLRLAGVIQSPQGTRAFDLELNEELRVSGVPAAFTARAERPGALALRLDLAQILGSMDWSTPDSDGDGVLSAADGAAENTLRFGALSTSSVTLTWTEP